MRLSNSWWLLVCVVGLGHAQWYNVQYETLDPMKSTSSAEDWSQWQQGCLCNTTSGLCEAATNVSAPFGWSAVEVLNCEVFGVDPMKYVVHPTDATLQFAMPFMALRGANGTDRFSFSVSPNAFVSLPAFGATPGYNVLYATDIHYGTASYWPLIALWLTNYRTNSGVVTIERRRYRCDHGACAAKRRYGTMLASQDATELQLQLLGGAQPATAAVELLSMDSLVVSYRKKVEVTPADGTGVHNLTAQLELFSNGSIIMRYQNTPMWPPTRNFFVPNAGVSLGVDGVSQLLPSVAQSVSLSGPPTDLSYFAARMDPRANSMASVTNDVMPDGSAGMMLSSIDACEALTSCSGCVASRPAATRVCGWCWGATPSTAGGAAGRCMDITLLPPQCPNRGLWVNRTNATQCDANPVALLLLRGESHAYSWSRGGETLWPESLQDVPNVTSIVGPLPTNVTLISELPQYLLNITAPWPFSVAPWRASVNASLECPPSTLFNVSSQLFVTVGDQGEAANATTKNLADVVVQEALLYCQRGVDVTAGYSNTAYCAAVDVVFVDERPLGDVFCPIDAAADLLVHGNPARCKRSVAVRWRGCLFNNQTASPFTTFTSLSSEENPLGTGFYTTELLLTVDGFAELRFPSAFTNAATNTGYPGLNGNDVGVYSRYSNFAPKVGDIGYALEPEHSSDLSVASMMAPGMKIEVTPLGDPCPRCQNNFTCNLTLRSCGCTAPFIAPRCMRCQGGWFYDLSAWPPQCTQCPTCYNGGSCGVYGSCYCAAGWFGAQCEIPCSSLQNNVSSWWTAMRFDSHNCSSVTLTNATGFLRATLHRQLSDGLSWAAPDRDSVVDQVDWTTHRATPATTAAPFPFFGFRGGAKGANRTASSVCTVGGDNALLLNAGAVTLSVAVSPTVGLSIMDSFFGEDFAGGVSVWPFDLQWPEANSNNTTNRGTVRVFTFTRNASATLGPLTTAGSIEEIEQQFYQLSLGLSPSLPSAATTQQRQGVTMTTLVVEWDGVHSFTGCDGTLTAQLELFPNGTFEIRYRTIPPICTELPDAVDRTSRRFVGAQILQSDGNMTGMHVTPPYALGNHYVPSYAVVRFDPIGIVPLRTALSVNASSKTNVAPAMDLRALDGCEAKRYCSGCDSGCIWCDGAATRVDTDVPEAVLTPFAAQGRCMNASVANLHCPNVQQRLPGQSMCPVTDFYAAGDPYKRYQRNGIPYRQVWISLAATNTSVPATGVLASSLLTLPMPTSSIAIIKVNANTIVLVLPFDINLFPNRPLSAVSTTRTLSISPYGTIATPVGSITAFGNVGLAQATRAAVLPQRTSPHPRCFTWDPDGDSSAAQNTSSAPPRGWRTCPAAVLVEWRGILYNNQSSPPLCVPVGKEDGLWPAMAGSWMRVLIESTGNVTFAFGAADGLGSNSSRFPWPSFVTIGLSSGTAYSSVVTAPQLSVSPYTAVTFTPTSALPCLTPCTGNSQCNRYLGVCQCITGYIGSSCTPCPQGTVYTVNSIGVAGCAWCPPCQHGGVCVASNDGNLLNATCQCPAAAGGPNGTCEVLCPFGHAYSDTCPTSTCKAPFACRCGVCYCTSDYVTPATDCSTDSGSSDAFIRILGACLIAIGAVLVTFVVFRVVAVIRTRYRNRRGQNGGLPAADEGAVMLDVSAVPERGTLRGEASLIPPGLLAHLVRNYDSELRERALRAHHAATNPLELSPPRRTPMTRGDEGDDAFELAGL